MRRRLNSVVVIRMLLLIGSLLIIQGLGFRLLPHGHDAGDHTAVRSHTRGRAFSVSPISRAPTEQPTRSPGARLSPTSWRRRSTYTEAYARARRRPHDTDEARNAERQTAVTRALPTSWRFDCGFRLPKVSTATVELCAQQSEKTAPAGILQKAAAVCEQLARLLSVDEQALEAAASRSAAGREAAQRDERQAEQRCWA